MTPTLWGLLAAVGWGSSDLLARITTRTLGPIGAMWGLSVTGSLIAALALPFLPTHLPHTAWPWLAAASFAALFGPLLFYRALRLGPMSLVAPLAAAYPAWIVLAAIATGLRPSPAAWFAMTLAFAGVIIVARTAPADPDSVLAADPANRRHAIITALLTSLAFAVSLLAGRSASARAGSLTTILAARLTATAVAGTTRPWRTPGFTNPKIWAVLLFQAILDNTAFAAFYLGSQHNGAAATAVAGSAFMVVAILLAAIFFHEHLNLPCAAGAAAVFAGIAFLAAAS